MKQLKISVGQLKEVIKNNLNEVKRFDPLPFIPSIVATRKARNVARKQDPQTWSAVQGIMRNLVHVYYNEGRKAAAAMGPGYVVHVNVDKLDEALSGVIAGYEKALQDLGSLPVNALTQDATTVVSGALTAFDALQSTKLRPDAIARAMRQIHILACEKRLEGL